LSSAWTFRTHKVGLALLDWRAFESKILRAEEVETVIEVSETKILNAEGLCLCEYLQSLRLLVDLKTAIFELIVECFHMLLSLALSGASKYIAALAYLDVSINKFQ